MHKILIVDDEADITEILSDIFKEEKYIVLTAHNASSALQKFAEEKPDMAILDIWLEGSEFDGIGVLKRFKAMSPDTPVIMISGHGNIEAAVQTIKLGAYDFIEKPFKAARLLLLARRALELTSLKKEIKGLKDPGQSEVSFSGTSKAISLVSETARLVAQSDSRVFITGGPGTGKEILARMIHTLSQRREMPFVPFHAQSLPEKEMEAELFGIDDGNTYCIGKLERANGGTLLLDEVSNLTVPMQAKLLKYLQEGYFHRIGSDKVIKSDVRIICSSGHDLAQVALTGGFNQSLFYRLNVASVHMPELKERKEDIPALIEDISQRLAHSLGLLKPKFTQEAIAYMQLYGWPGNVRQLKNVIEWLMILKGTFNSEVQVADLPQDIMSNAETGMPALSEELILKPLKPARDHFEREYLKAQLSRFSGNISKTADFVGMERTAFHRKLKGLKISGV